MRIAIVTTWYPSERNPLYGIFINNQVKALSEHCEVFVLLLKWSLVPFTKERREGKVTIIEKGDFYFPNASEQFLSFWASRYVRFFKKIHEQFSFDLLHCHDHYGTFVGDKIKQKFNLPYVSTIHNSNILNDKLVDWKKAYLKRILGNADQVISVSHKLGEVLSAKYDVENVEVVPNYIDTDKFDLNPNKPSNTFRYIFVGGLEAHKGVKNLVEAFCRANIDHSELHIVGEGELMSSLISLVKKLEKEHSVIFHGQLANEDLPEVYNSCHVYVSVSEYETFGVSVLEAMSCGLPVLYTSSGGPDEIIHKHSGLLLKNRKEETIAQGLKEIKDNYHEFDISQIRQHVMDNFGSEKVIQSLLTIYKSVLDV